jgi:RHS repeat-associated protein
MKAYAVVAIVMTVLALGSTVRAQTCWTPVNSWQANYTLTASGTVPCSGATCSVNQSASSTAIIASGDTSCSASDWDVTSVGFTGSLDDVITINCGSGPVPVDTFSGTNSVSSSSLLFVNPSKGTYEYAPNNVTEQATFTYTPCVGSPSSSTIDVDLVPQGDPNWPQSFTLTPNVGPLSTPSDSFNAATIIGAAVPWTFSFTLTPKYNSDHDCKKNGGSSIGCLNQSLGEDVPIVGTGFSLHYESDRNPSAGGNSIASADASMIGGWTLNVHHVYDPNTSTLFFGDGTQRNGQHLGTPVSFNGNLLLTSEDGSEVYVFSAAGQHVATSRPLTGAIEYKFGYDSAAKLITITDASGNVTTIQRNASEQPTAIVSPFDQTTTFALDSDGFLSQITDPLGKSQSFVNTSTGLLTSRTDSNGNVFNYTYDANGRLTNDADPLGGFVSASRTDATSGFGWTVGEITSMGRTSSYETTLTLPWIQDGTQPVSEQQSITWPDGLVATSSQSLSSNKLTESFTLPDGTSDTETLGPDPVWGLQSPVDTSETLTEGSLTMSITGSRATTLGTVGNPFTVSAETDTQTINGRTYTSTFTSSTRKWVNASPVGRTLTVGLDSLERIASTQIEGLTAMNFAYDSHGRLASAVQGTRKTVFAYDSDGFLASITDPLTLTTSFGYDADGHLTTTTLPDGRLINYSYDANGNLASVTPPGKSAHDFTYNAVNLPTSYTPPTVLGTGATTYAYNLDRDLTTVTRPDGETINYGYDTAGRLISVGTPTGTTGFTYNATTGDLDTANRGAEKLSYSYNGPLPTKSTWKGTVAGSVSRVYNDNFWTSSQSVGGSSSIKFAYDNDGLVTKAGSLTIKRSAKNGLITSTTLGVSTDSRSYDSFGELIAYTASANGIAVYTVTYTRDADGRVTGKSETINGTSNTYSYTYDLAGRLTSAVKNSTTDTYTYDSNSNRLSGTTASGTSNGTYDAQDRLLTYGTASYTYTADGELASQKTGSQKTTYKYDVLGNLISAMLPSGTKLAYIIDARNRRVGKEVNGVLQTGFLYDGDQIVAQLNGSNVLVSQFVYGTGSTSPDYMVSGGITYRIFSDQLGSPVLVVNTSTGAITGQITYDEFGNVLSDTNPGFQPFGFAGGLYDQDTKLVRFGARDYKSSVGRWTAKDPIQFRGGDTNLYGYVLDDPVNLRDPSGQDLDGTLEAVVGYVWDWIHGVFGKEPPVVGEAGQLLSPEGAEAERSVVDILQAKRALDCLDETGDVEVYHRIKGLSTKDFLKEGGITCPCK